MTEYKRPVRSHRPFTNQNNHRGITLQPIHLLSCLFLGVSADLYLGNYNAWPSTALLMDREMCM